MTENIMTNIQEEDLQPPKIIRSKTYRNSYRVSFERKWLSGRGKKSHYKVSFINEKS